MQNPLDPSGSSGGYSAGRGDEGQSKQCFVFHGALRGANGAKAHSLNSLLKSYALPMLCGAVSFCQEVTPKRCKLMFLMRNRNVQKHQK